MLIKNYDLKSALISYQRLLNNQKYFEAHEVLEKIWHPLRKSNHPLKNLAKGLINGAIYFEHLCKKGIEYFKEFQECCDKIEALKELHKL